MAELIKIVLALVLHPTQKSSVLLGLRPEGKPFADLWEFPGGKLEVWETPEIALARELREELGLSGLFVLRGSQPFYVTYDADLPPCICTAFVVSAGKTPSMLHHKELRYIDLDELRREVATSPERFTPATIAALQNHWSWQ